MKAGRRFGLIGESGPIYLLAKAAGSPASPSTAEQRRYDRLWTPVQRDFAVPNLEQA